MTRAPSMPLTDELAARARRAADVPALAAAIWTAIGSRVPFVFACLATTDPSTGLISTAYKSTPLPMGDQEFSAVEYGGADVNLFAEIATRSEPVGVLSLDTGGRLDSCRRFREYLVPQFGFTDELRVVFRDQGLTWGALALYRGAGDPPFGMEEARTVVDVHTRVAEILRRAIFRTPRGPVRAAPGPSVIVLDSADRVAQITPAASERIDELGGWDHGELPAPVLAAAATARSAPELAVTRVLGRSGSWYIVRASTFAADPGTGRPADVVVTVDLAAPTDISAMALAARGLSSREQDVAGLVLQGAATGAIAAALHLSPHTVQDHLKSIFVKLGVNSRREMVGQLAMT